MFFLAIESALYFKNFIKNFYGNYFGRLLGNYFGNFFGNFFKHFSLNALGSFFCNFFWSSFRKWFCYFFFRIHWEHFSLFVSAIYLEYPSVIAITTFLNFFGNSFVYSLPKFLVWFFLQRIFCYFFEYFLWVYSLNNNKGNSNCFESLSDNNSIGNFFRQFLCKLLCLLLKDFCPQFFFIPSRSSFGILFGIFILLYTS